MARLIELRPRQCIDFDSRGTLLLRLKRSGTETFEFDGSHVKDEASFFTQAAVDLPQPKDRITTQSWDALSDNLYDTFYYLSCSQVVIIWSYPDQLYTNDLETFFQALDTVEMALGEWASRTAGRRGFVVFLGKGASFKRW